LDEEKMSEIVVSTAETGRAPTVGRIHDDGHIHRRNTAALRDAAILLILVALSVLLHHSAVGLGLVADDFNYLRPQTAREIFLTPGGNYRPLGRGILILAFQTLGELTPVFLHSAALLFHAVNAFLLFLLARELTRQNLVSLVASCLWLSSPSAIEPVYWLTASVFYLPMAGLVLGTMILIRRATAARYGPPVLTWSKQLAFSASIAACYALSLLFHEIAIITPAILAVMVYGGARRKLSLAEQAVLWSPTVLVMIGYAALRLILSTPSSLLDYAASERAGFLVLAVWKSLIYTDHVIWRIVHFVWSLTPIAAWLVTLVLVSLALVVPLVLRAYRPVLGVLLALILATLPPILFSSTNGRYLYLSSAMGSLALTLVVALTLRPADEQTDPGSRSMVARNMVVIEGLIACAFLLLVAMNVRQGTRDAQVWFTGSRIAQRLQNRTVELVLSSLQQRSNSDPVDILMVDFPSLLPPSALVAALFRESPERFDAVRVSSVILNERASYEREHLRDTSHLIEYDALSRAAASHIILVFCTAEQQTFLYGTDDIPCLRKR
jgi:hypothetical protein